MSDRQHGGLLPRTPLRPELVDREVAGSVRVPGTNQRNCAGRLGDDDGSLKAVDDAASAIYATATRPSGIFQQPNSSTQGAL
jgi:hypothetical protein